MKRIVSFAINPKRRGSCARSSGRHPLPIRLTAWRCPSGQAETTVVKILRLASAVFGKSSREAPADKVLRETLRSQHDLTRNEGFLVSRIVFAYYRWLGWLKLEEPLRDQVRHAQDLAERFAARPESFSNEELVERTAPAWLRNEMEVTPAWARALQSEPRLWLRSRPGQGRALAARLGDTHIFGQGSLSEILEYRGAEDLFRTREFHAGEFELQDISSQAVSLACDPEPGETWWDACAGEGGKTLHLSELMENKGLIWATDRAAWRLQKLKQRAARARMFNYRTALWNGGPKLPTKTRFDGVLIDAPCSGTGTWGRNPHARWTTTLQDVRELGEVQKQLLANAAAALKPGGRLVYAVCTLTRSETFAVVETFEKQFAEFERLALSNPLEPGSIPATPLWLLPQQFGGNGMFIAAWVKK